MGEDSREKTTSLQSKTLEAYSLAQYVQPVECLDLYDKTNGRFLIGECSVNGAQFPKQRSSTKV